MYPLSEGLFAVRNQWYVAAWSSEVGREPIERWVMDEPVAFYRTTAGQAVALAGRCPHRNFPLGKSRVDGDNIECGYHGIVFAPDGHCVRIPSQAQIPANCKVRSYPVAERWKWIWIWTGDPEKADEALIPDHEALGFFDPQFEIAADCYYSVPGRYTLMHDNLFDLTHLAFLHRSSIGANSDQSVEEIRENGPDWISSKREFKNIECPPYYSQICGYYGPIDRAFGMKLYYPCLHAGYDDLTKANNSGESSGESVGRVRIWHAITPATRHTAHYFFAYGSDFAVGNPAMALGMQEALRPTLEEDMMATRELERMIQACGAKAEKEVLLRSDATCVRGRRIFEDLIRAEMAGQ